MDKKEEKLTKSQLLKKREDKIKSIIGKHLPLLNKQYQTNLQVAKFTDLRQVEELKGLLEVGYDKGENEDQSYVYFINGAVQPIDKKLFEKFTLQFIKTLDHCIDKCDYTLVYFVGDEAISSGFTRFREFMKTLPVKYYVRMKQMYVYHASILVRSFLFLETSKRGKLWKKMTTYIGSLDELFEQPHFHSRWLEKVPQFYKENQNLENLQYLRSQSLLSQPFEQVNHESIFGRELNTYSLNSKQIPIVLDHLIAFFLRKPERLQQQGIFRKCGSGQEVLQLAQLLSEENFDVLKVTNDVNVVADIIKKLFNSLQTPLIPYELYDLIVLEVPKCGNNQSAQIELIQNVLGIMQSLNRRCLQVMLSFILSIAQYESINKMTIHNLAVVFAPCFMRPKQGSVKQVLEIGFIISFLNMLLKNYYVVYPHMTYNLFLENQEKSETTSSSSSQGFETQNFDEEHKDAVLERYQKSQLKQNENDDIFTMIQSDDFLGRPQTGIIQLNDMTGYDRHNTTSNREDLEFHINDILNGIIQDKKISKDEKK